MEEALPGAGDTADGATMPPLGQGGLKRAALRASFFEIGGYGATQLLRFGSNLVLSRLLFPEAFGLVALVNIFNQALAMLSDVGLQEAIVQNPRGEHPDLLDTAWTIQVGRGFLLYGVALAMAWPLAAIYRQPELSWLICAGSASVLLQGMNSTSLFRLKRRLALGKLAAIDVGAQAVGVAVMIPLAYSYRTVWALVGGLLAGPAVRLVASYAVDSSHRHRLRIDPAARHALLSFGKWIFASSAVFFVGQQGDRILLGRFMGIAELGIYSIAVFLSESVKAVVTRLTSSVLFPVLSRVHEQGTSQLRSVYYRARLPLDALSLPALGVLTMLGPWVVHLLYDSRYADAGWMLRAFAFRVAVTCMLNPCETCLFSTGQARYGLYENIVRLIWIAIGIPLGWHFYGLPGIVYVTALSELPLVLVLWLPFHKLGLLRPLLELRAVGFYAGGLLLGWGLSSVLP